MSSDESPRTNEVLLCGLTFTISVIGFSIRWENVDWCYGSPVLFVPLFLASGFCGIRLLGIDPTITRCGIRAKILWMIIASLTLIIAEPAVTSLVVLVLASYLIVRWFVMQFQNAERNVKAAASKR